MIIHPEIDPTPNRPVVQIREPWETVDLDALLARVLRVQGWGLGTYFHVQFIDHDRTRLLSEGSFVVIGVTEKLQTSEANPYQPMTKAVTTREYRQIGEWEHLNKTEPMTVKWNLGKKAYDIVRGGAVVASIADKERAHAVAAGAEPLPEAA